MRLLGSLALGLVGAFAVQLGLHQTHALGAALNLLPLARASDPGPVRVEVLSILSTGDGRVHAAVLAPESAEWVLPLVVSPEHAEALQQLLVEQRSVPTAPALARRIAAAGGRPEAVILEGPDRTAVSARVRLLRWGFWPTRVEAAPSEALAWAVAHRVPIVAGRALFEASGLSPQALRRALGRAAEPADEEPSSAAGFAL